MSDSSLLETAGGPKRAGSFCVISLSCFPSPAVASVGLFSQRFLISMGEITVNCSLEKEAPCCEEKPDKNF